MKEEMGIKGRGKRRGKRKGKKEGERRKWK